MAETDGLIELTPFGNLVASGEVTPFEFSVLTILTLTLPNETFGDSISWHKANLKLKPLRLILEVLVLLAEHECASAFLTPRELYEVVIPLAGVPGTPLRIISQALLQRREGTITIEDWPDCAPRDNDKRMAGEFLLFLSYYGHLVKCYEDGLRDDVRYYLPPTQARATADLLKLELSDFTETTFGKLLCAPEVVTVQRERRMTSVLARPQQQLFRTRVLRAANFSCAICGVNVPEVLEAAHIVPVMHNGSDSIDNGLCLRADLHCLFDSGHLRIMPDGILIVVGEAAKPSNYGGKKLPRRIEIPASVARKNLDFRSKYL